MNKALTLSASITINASPASVWDGLTNPEKTKQYLYGTETKTDWKVGSPILFTGEWEGKPFMDKGEVVAYDALQKLQYTYFSNFTGVEDKPENYSLVTFELTPEGDGTKLTVSQNNFKDEGHRDHTQDNWKLVLADIKRILESKAD